MLIAPALHYFRDASMSKFTPEIAGDVANTCQENAAEIAKLLREDGELAARIGEPSEYNSATPPGGWNASGLLLLLHRTEEAFAAVLPDAAPLLGEWVGEPDAESQAKRQTLAEELALLILPEASHPTDVTARWVDDLSQGLNEAGLENGATLTPISLERGDESRQLSLVWPCKSPTSAQSSPAPEQVKNEPPQAKSAPPAAKRPMPTSLSELPPYAKHLLKIEVPVSVRLVSKKLSVHELLELGPGAMISFDKSCDDALELTVRNQTVARGTAVKVGERFGLEIESITLPEEHFWAVRRTG